MPRPVSRGTLAYHGKNYREIIGNKVRYEGEASVGLKLKDSPFMQ